jgi:hypothetical protein
MPRIAGGKRLMWFAWTSGRALRRAVERREETLRTVRCWERPGPLCGDCAACVRRHHSTRYAATFIRHPCQLEVALMAAGISCSREIAGFVNVPSRID